MPAVPVGLPFRLVGLSAPQPLFTKASKSNEQDPGKPAAVKGRFGMRTRCPDAAKRAQTVCMGREHAVSAHASRVVGCRVSWKSVDVMDLLIAYAIPVFVLSIAAEIARTRKREPAVYEAKDTRASLTLGIGAVIAGVPFRLAFLFVLAQLYEHRLFTIEAGVLGFTLLLFAEDLCYYFSHRTNHMVRLFWAAHVNHHSSERYHLATALRQSWTQPYLMWIFWLPLPLLGFRAEWILVQQSLSLIYQFFIHTQEVGKLGPLEWVMNTPSHHRVHHAVNLRYLDRNHGGIFIIWDRLFGTFAQEREDDPPVYGITRNIGTYDLLHIAFHEWRALLADVKRAPTLKTKLAYVFLPPGYSHDGSTQTSEQLRARITSVRAS
jgi:sterol desaturase/sphingolipid hydroxylase (fatty acid hydroxylase superfamily)